MGTFSFVEEGKAELSGSVSVELAQRFIHFTWDLSVVHKAFFVALLEAAVEAVELDAT